MGKAEKKQIEVVIDGQKLIAKARDFQSGNKGFGLYGVLKIGEVNHRIIFNLIRLGKKKDEQNKSEEEAA